MSPQQLLKETQRAAGNENLTAWHDTLISAGKDLTGLETVSSIDKVLMLSNFVFAFKVFGGRSQTAGDFRGAQRHP